MNDRQLVGSELLTSNKVCCIIVTYHVKSSEFGQQRFKAHPVFEANVNISLRRLSSDVIQQQSVIIMQLLSFKCNIIF